MPTSSLVSLGGESVVVDCGLGVTTGLVAQGFKLADLRHIAISHLHSDHYLELGPLLHTAWVSGLSSTVQVVGPGPLVDYWRHFLSSMRDDIDIRIIDEGRPDLAKLVEFIPLTDGKSLELGSIRLQAIHNDHFPLKDSYAFSLEAQGKKIVFSGDTAYLPALEDFSAKADLLVHEAVLAPGLVKVAKKAGNGDDRLLEHLKRAHCTAQDAARTATAAGVKRLALHHLIPSGHPEFGMVDWEDAVREHWQGPLFVGHDGMSIEL